MLALNICVCRYVATLVEAMSWTWVPDDRGGSGGGSGSGKDEYRAAFYFAAVVALVYPFYLQPVIRQALTNELGKAGATPPFLSGQWFYRMGLGLFGQTLFPMIVTTLLACFACDFHPVASGGNALARDAAIGCLGKLCLACSFTVD